MRPSGWLLLTQLFICCALGASAVLYLHYLNPADSEFCGPTSGCETVRQSGLGYFLGSRFVSLPLFALVAFTNCLLLSLRCAVPPEQVPAGQASPEEVPRKDVGTGLAALWHRPELSLFVVNGLGAIIAVGLILYQAFVLEEFCWLCLIVDGVAIAAGISSFLLARSVRTSGKPASSPLQAGAWLLVGLLLVAAPPFWNVIRPPAPVPERISALYQPGKINVVEFVDFECPHCRRLHALLAPLLEQYGDRVHFVRVNRPLSQHPNAQPAARAAVCAEQQGQGTAMADQLFSIPLSLERIDAVARDLHFDMGRFGACMDSPETLASLEQQAAILPDEVLRGLPTTYVGSKVIVGVGTEAAFRDAFEHAQRAELKGPIGPLYFGAVVTALALVAWFGRRRGAAAADPRVAA